MDGCALLFVYGTLLAADAGEAGRAQRARLARETRRVGPATIEGKLYNLGRYPGLFPSPGAGSAVRGDVLELVTPERTFAWLDLYEGIVPGQHPHNEYERRVETVGLADGRLLAAWVYVYRRTSIEAQHIPGGSWLER